jgi:hypothetical protein
MIPFVKDFFLYFPFSFLGLGVTQKSINVIISSSFPLAPLGERVRVRG